MIDQSYVENDLVCLLNTGQVDVFNVLQLRRQISCDVICRENLTLVTVVIIIIIVANIGVAFS